MLKQKLKTFNKTTNRAEAVTSAERKERYDKYSDYIRIYVIK